MTNEHSLEGLAKFLRDLVYSEKVKRSDEDLRRWADAVEAVQRSDDTLIAVAEQFRNVLQTPDGQGLAAMIAQGVTELESHIHYAIRADAKGPEHG